MFGNGMGMNVPVVADLNGGNNGFGNGGWWILIILLALFGGFGNNGVNGGVGAEVQRGFDTQTIVSKLDGINNGICSLGYDQLAQMNNIASTVMQTGYGLQNTMMQNQISDMQSFNALQAALQNCCCENRAAIAQVRYDMATDTCALKTAIEGVNRTIIDQFCQLKMEQKDATIAEQASLIQSLNLAQSQANQNAYLINALRPSPVPSYYVPNPYASYGYQGGCGCGTNFNNGCGTNFNNGCGCSC